MNFLDPNTAEAVNDIYLLINRLSLHTLVVKLSYANYRENLDKITIFRIILFRINLHKYRQIFSESDNTISHS